MSNPIQAPARNGAFDFLRVLAAFAVVMAHIATGVVFHNPALDNPQWWVGDLADGFGRWSVPVFIMLSGALLIPKSRGVAAKSFLMSRMPRILWPAIVWSGFYVFISTFITHNIGRVGLFNAVMGDEPFFHLWYFYLAIFLYAMTPLLQRFYDWLDRKTLVVLICISFTIATVVGFPSLSGGFTIFALISLLGYFLLGVMLVELKPPTLKQRQMAGAVAVISGFGIVGFAGLLMPQFGVAGWEYMFSFPNVLVAVMSVCIFWAARGMRAHPILAKLAPSTLGIYAIHPLWVVQLSKLGITGFTFGPVIGIPLTTVLVFALSFVSVLVLAQIRFLRPVLM